MKVGLVDLNQPKINRRNVSFEGYKPVKSEYGDREYEFNYVYNDNERDCYLEIFLVDKDDNGNYFVTGDRDFAGNKIPLQNYTAAMNGEDGLSIKLESGKPTVIDLAADYGIAPDQAFAYHYVLRPKNMPDGLPEYKIDYGNVINDIGTTGQAHDIYNYVTDRTSTISKGGAMKLVLPDINNVAWVYDKDNKIVPNQNIEKARKTNKNLVNKIGGSLAGIEKDLDDGKLDNYTRIITTPLFTDDSLTAHGYWNKNCFQMAHSLGNINNYASLQRKMFSKGINLVSDGAYVNEGLEGVHFQHVLRWGKKSPYFNWFRISGLEDSPLSMGVFGKRLEHITHRVINSKYDFEPQKDGSVKIKSNKNYDSNKPTYIQIYDDRLVNTQGLNEKELIEEYDKLLENNLDINTHNDSVIPYSFKINPDTYMKNVKLLSDFNKNTKNESQKVDMYSGEGTRAVAQFEFFGLDGKHESGFETWDANPDIAKLNYVPSHNETQRLKNITDPQRRIEIKKELLRKNMEVQDYAVSSAKFWTKKTNDILNLYVAQNLKNIDGKSAQQINEEIDKLIDKGVLPEDLDVNKDIIRNVLRGRYSLNGNDTEDNYNKAILQGLMNTPLDSIEVGDDIVSVLASPFMTKRAIKANQIGVSRYDMYVKKNPHVTPEIKEAYDKTDNLYEKEMSDFAKEIIDSINTSLPNDKKLKDSKGNTTPYGKYVIPLLTSEIVKFAVIKSVAPDAPFKYNSENGEISYDYKALKKTSLLQSGIIADSPEDEAISLINKLKNGIKRIDTNDKAELKKALTKSIQGTSYESFALADMIVDRSQAGLDWRIDATKDMADIDSLKSGKTDYEYTWNKIIEFWSRFTDGVKEYHPDAYIAAEVTDADYVYSKGKGQNSGTRFSDAKEGVKKLINEGGFTTIANYDYLSSGLTQIFGKLFDFDGHNSPDKGLMQGSTINNQLSTFYTKEPLESIIYSYTFAGNHDKCRALEGYAVDMDMVYADLTDPANYEYRQRALKILNAIPYGQEPYDHDVNNHDFSRVSNLAIAKSESISSGMGKAAYKIGLDDNKAKYVYGAMLDALKNLSNGLHKGKVFEADGFGTKDFSTAIDIVLDEMDYIEKETYRQLTPDEKKRLKDKTLEFILDPAMSKLLGHIKFLVALSGNPTLFSGDEYGASGFETTTKNIFLQNRNIIHEEWAEKLLKNGEKNPEYKDFVKRFKNYVDYQFALRKRPELAPLNDGAPFLLDVHGAKYRKPIYENNFFDNVNDYQEGTTQISALLRQSTNGGMTVSLFNTEGITHKYDEYYRPAEIELKEIGLGSGRYEKQQVNGGLKDGLKFYDANELDKPKNERTLYVTQDNIIKRADGQPIRFKDSTLILCHQPSFTGKKVLYNPQYNFVSKPYANTNTPKAQVGSKLQILAK